MSGVEITGGGPLPPHSAIVARHKRIATKAVTEVTLAAEREWRTRAARSRRTGHYLRSITHRITVHATVVIGEVGTNLVYAVYLEYGTGLYGPRNRWIAPKHGRVLRFPAEGGGRHVFSRVTGEHAGFQTAPGFRLSGQQRAGRAGEAARYVYARRVRGIRPRRYARDAAMVARPTADRLFHLAGLQMAQALAGRP